MRLAVAGISFLASCIVGQAQSALTGQRVTMSVTANGTTPFNYQWAKNGVSISGATGNAYVIPFAQGVDAASYSVTVSNAVSPPTTAFASISVSPTPVNDAFALATVITGPAAIIRGTNVSATKEAGEPNHAGNAGGHSVWWKWTAPQSGRYTVSSVGSNFDTLLGVYTGSFVSALTAMTPVSPAAWGDDISGTLTTSLVSFQAISGTTYYFSVDGKNGATGAILFQLTNQSDFLAPFPITTLAGSAGVANITDGTGANARFHNPGGVAVDTSGNIYVADRLNHTIRVVSPAGSVTTLAGSGGVVGSVDGTGSSARFNNPSGIAVDASGNIYVADTGNNTIRLIKTGGVVTTLAGSAGIAGSTDGLGNAARFNNPSGIAVDATGSLIYVADTSNHTIRLLNPGGAVSTLAGAAGALGSVDGTGSVARFNNPLGVAVDLAGNVYVADSANSTIRRIAPGAIVSTVAGSPLLLGSSDSTDGTGGTARFNNPSGVGVDPAGNVYVADYGNHTLRFITTQGVVSTISGLAGNPGALNGTGTSVRFSNPRGVALDAAGNLYVADFSNHTIRKGALTVALPVFIIQPANQNLVTGLPVTLFATGTGGAGTTFQWFLNGIAVQGANNSSLFVPVLDLAHAGTYQLAATNSAGTSYSTAFVVSGLAVASQFVAFHRPVTLSVSTAGLPVTSTFQWYHNGVLIPGATAATYHVSDYIVPADLGTYTVVTTNAAGSITSNVATLAFPPLADFNGDGNSDIIWQNTSTGECSVWLMSGGFYQSGVSLGVIPTDWKIVATGDFNGDGQTDLVWQNSVTGDHSIWLMNGSTFVSGVGLGVADPTQWSIVGTGDFDGDGHPDLVWQNSVTGEISIWVMDGPNFRLGADLPFRLPTATNPGWTIAAVDDFNGDGRPDLLWRNTITGEVVIYLMDGTNFVAGVSLGSPPIPPWNIAGTGDFNGDGATDILWENTSTGERVVWLMNGTTFVSGYSLGFIPTQWSIRN